VNTVNKDSVINAVNKLKKQRENGFME